MNLKQDYEKLKKKYNLPDYDKLDFEFELLYITGIQEINFPLRYIRRRMCDKISWYIGHMQSILQPNPSSIINMQESSFLAEDKDKITELIKELIRITSVSILRELEYDEKEDAEFIKNNFKRWIDLKKELIILNKKIINKWKEKIKEEKSKEKYIG